MSDKEVAAKSPVSYGKYVMIWFALLALTAASLRFGQWSALAAILIATVKGSLVLFYFMHLRYESPLLKLFMTIAILTLVIIMIVTFLDESVR